MQHVVSKTWGQRLSPFRIAFIYFAVSVVYILLSDLFVFADVAPERQWMLQTGKGIVFVTLSAALVFALVHVHVQDRLKAERDANKARLEYRRLLEIANEGVWIVDAEGSTVFVNSAFADMLGVSVDDLLETGVGVYLDADTRKLFDRKFTERSDVHADSYETRLLHADGSEVCVLVSANAIFDDAEAFSGCLRLITDITARKKSEEALSAAYELQRDLLNELNHRVRNNLASLAGLIDITRQAAPDVGEFAHDLRERVISMAAAYAALSDAKWQPVALRTLLMKSMPAVHPVRVDLDGPDIRIPPALIPPLVFIVAEVFELSRDVGVLRAGAGTITITWEVMPHAASSLVLRWVEHTNEGRLGMPAEQHPSVLLVRGVIESDTQGTFQMYTPSAQEIGYEMCVPLHDASGLVGQTE